ncbi:MAG TPA: tetratricopeptide repeat protein [Planctomycetota bacterium]
MGLLSALSACTYFPNDFERIVDQSERRYGPGIGREYKEVSLREVAAHATSYKHVDIKFTALFNRRNEQIFVPLLTTFAPESWAAFSVWPADAKLWEEQDRILNVPTLYIRKDQPDMTIVTSASRYALFEVRGHVMGDFDDRPFIQVYWIQEVEPAVYTDEGLAALNTGLAALQQKRPAVAIDKLEKALAGVWTRDARLRIHLDLATLYGERGDWDAAVLHYEGALANDPENATAKAGLEKAKVELARKQAVEAGKPQP